WRPSRNASINASGGLPTRRTPIRGIFFACCAWARWIEGRSKSAKRAAVIRRFILGFLGIRSAVFEWFADFRFHGLFHRAGLRSRFSSQRRRLGLQRLNECARRRSAPFSRS